MAIAGDGTPRSERRRLTATLSLRLGDAEKRRFAAAAKRSGSPSLAAWALDRMRNAGDAGLRERRIIWTDDDGTERLMVIYDSPNPARIDTEKGTILADLFALD